MMSDRLRGGKSDDAANEPTIVGSESDVEGLGVSLIHSLDGGDGGAVAPLIHSLDGGSGGLTALR